MESFYEIDICVCYHLLLEVPLSAVSVADPIYYQNIIRSEVNRKRIDEAIAI